jgi:hypothetical protein
MWVTLCSAQCYNSHFLASWISVIFYTSGGWSSTYILGCYNLAVDVKCIFWIYLYVNHWCTFLLCCYNLFCCQERKLSRNNSICKNCIYIVDHLRYHAVNMYFLWCVCFYVIRLCTAELYPQSPCCFVWQSLSWVSQTSWSSYLGYVIAAAMWSAKYWILHCSNCGNTPIYVQTI